MLVYEQKKQKNTVTCYSLMLYQLSYKGKGVEIPFAANRTQDPQMTVVKHPENKRQGGDAGSPKSYPPSTEQTCATPPPSPLPNQ